MLTGATGFIGSYIARRLIANGYSIMATKRAQSSYALVDDVKNQIEWHEVELSDIYSLGELIKDADAVIHAAGPIDVDPVTRPQET